MITSILLSAALLIPVDAMAPWRDSWAEKAREYTPELISETVCPARTVEVFRSAEAFQGCGIREASYPRQLDEGCAVVYDFGRHVTGYLTLEFKVLRRTQDAPARLKINFAEVPSEFYVDKWPASIGRGWMQEEIITVEDVSKPLELPRRLSGQYLRVELLSGSAGFDMGISGVSFRAVSSAGENMCPVSGEIGSRALSTLRECMQTVLEDGPKRDRRLWGIDSYFGALSNNYSFRNQKVVLRSLYLLASLSSEDGLLYADVFETPFPHPQDGNYSLDCSLFYPPMLLEYARSFADTDTVRDLWPIVERQLDAIRDHIGEDYVFNPAARYSWLIFDWNEGLDRRVQTQGIMIWSLKAGAALAAMTGHPEREKEWTSLAAKMSRAAVKHFYNRATGLFESSGQISWNSQIWMVVSGAVTGKKAEKCLKAVPTCPSALLPGTPAANHFLVEAYLAAGMEKEARERLLSYWGGMVSKVTDTLPEVFDPEDDFTSPYGYHPVNSYCHLWSTTPLYFMGKYPSIGLL